jgi:hypothetical protein
MDERITYIGLDVHKETIAVALAEGSGRGQVCEHGQIYALLRNPIYIGKIRHKANVWDGLHEAIIDTVLWDRVQTKLQDASARPRSRVGSAGSGPCQRQSKSEPKGSAKCCHFGSGVMSGYACASIRAAALVI